MSQSNKNQAVEGTNQGFALQLLENPEATFSERIKLAEKPVASLKPGQVLVKVLAAPVNPSDLVYLMGKYGIPPVEGAFAGFEACGEVIAANAGLYGAWLKGKRVAIFATPGLDGVWANYCVTGAQYCVPVRKELTDEQAATMVVNPCTSVCLVERAEALGAKALVINAAASQVGKGVIRYAKQRGLKTIATVRSANNIPSLEALGADLVLDTTSADFKASLKKAAKSMRAKVLLDAVADRDTPRNLGVMPNGSTAIVYGRLTETHDPLGGYFSVADVIFRDVKIEGFWLSTYIKRSNPLAIYRLTRKVQKLFAAGIFDTDIYGTFDFNGFPAALEHYAEHKSDGKVILRPNG
ncbi:zinc-binding dehydrogenase [Aliikangiella marina]|uniref:Zinc-binding dehydrogenase n=1 Tax=Aliikangiella marina TaxID=1712262 RepID=A0A545T6F0_9GAMM|nr:zinc-binding dehydrogenase [Aliikangiella marina]TQV72801.1 zinc-binding dehydrogenase [Aliikangiella marina]